MLSKIIQLLSFQFSKLNILQVSPKIVPLLFTQAQLFENVRFFQIKNETIDLKNPENVGYFEQKLKKKKQAETLQTFKDVSCKKQKGKTLKKERQSQLVILLIIYFMHKEHYHLCLPSQEIDFSYVIHYTVVFVYQKKTNAWPFLSSHLLNERNQIKKGRINPLKIFVKISGLALERALKKVFFA